MTFVRVRKSLAETNDSNGKESTEVDSKNDKFETENFSFLPKMIFDRHEGILVWCCRRTAVVHQWFNKCNGARLKTFYWV